MKTTTKIIILTVLVVAIAAVFVLKQRNANQADSENVPVEISVASVKEQALPTLIDLGADKCIPCKMMAPILEDLEENYAGQMNVIFYDVWKNKEPAQQYGIRSIPTQIFLSPDGEELFRHEGFYSKEDIIAKWKEFGFDMESLETGN